MITREEVKEYIQKNEEIDLIGIEHPEQKGKIFLFRAPEYSGIEVGDEVIVETCKGEKRVKAVLTKRSLEPYDTDYLLMAITLSGCYLPLKKVLKKVQYKVFTYKEDTESEE